MPLNNPTKSGAATSGGYTGDGSVNRAIPHGHASTPKFIAIVKTAANDNSGDMAWKICPPQARIMYCAGGVGSSLAVTTPDSTNFYVGNATNYTQSANENIVAYRWVAIP